MEPKHKREEGGEKMMPNIVAHCANSVDMSDVALRSQAWRVCGQEMDARANEREPEMSEEVN